MIATYFLNYWPFLAGLVLALGILGYFVLQLIREISPSVTLAKNFSTEINQTVNSMKEMLPTIDSIKNNLNANMQEIQDLKQTFGEAVDNIKKISFGVTAIRSNKNVNAAVRYAKAQMIKRRRNRWLSRLLSKKGLKRIGKWFSKKYEDIRSGDVQLKSIKSPIDRLGRLLQKPEEPKPKKLGWKVPALFFAGGGIIGSAIVSFSETEERFPTQARAMPQGSSSSENEERDFLRSSSGRAFPVVLEQRPQQSIDQDREPAAKLPLKKFSIGEIPTILKETFSEWSKNKTPRLGAALSYYTIFSLAPTLVVVISIAGLVFGADAVQTQIITQVQGLIGKEGADAVREMLMVARHPKIGFVATIIGVVTLLLGASGVFGELQDAMNTIWGVTPKETGGWIRVLRQRFTSFAMVLGIGFLLLASLVISAGLAALGKYMGTIFGVPETLLMILNLAFSFLVITLLFALLFRVVPDAKIAWRDVWVGAAVTSLLFTAGKFAIGLYLGKSNVTSAFGAAGSLALILVWVYYSAQIVFFGAEFTKVYANRYGSRIRP